MNGTMGGVGGERGRGLTLKGRGRGSENCRGSEMESEYGETDTSDVGNG